MWRRIHNVLYDLAHGQINKFSLWFILNLQLNKKSSKDFFFKWFGQSAQWQFGDSIFFILIGTAHLPVRLFKLLPFLCTTFQTTKRCKIPVQSQKGQSMSWSKVSQAKESKSKFSKGKVAKVQKVSAQKKSVPRET